MFWCPIILTLQYWYATSVQLCWRQTLTMWLSTVTTYVGCNFAFIKERDQQGDSAQRSMLAVEMWTLLPWDICSGRAMAGSLEFIQLGLMPLITKIFLLLLSVLKGQHEQHRLPLKSSSHIRYCLIITFQCQGKSHFYPKQPHWTITKSRGYIQWNCVGINEGITWPAEIFINDDDSQGKII